MSAIEQRVRELVLPLIEDPETELYDVEYTGGVLRIVLDRPGGIDMGTITAVTRAVSAALDAADPLPSAYTLEVSSPGLERTLRTPAHFAGAVGRTVKLKLRPGIEGDRRLQGELTAADEQTVTVTDGHGEQRVVRIDDVTRANVHVDWSPPPKPGSKKTAAGASRSDDADTATTDTPRSEATS
jgi:ribosome maturation factor RimP